MSTFDPSLGDAALTGDVSLELPDYRPLQKPVRPVVAHLPASLTGGVALEVLFRAPDQVDVRPAGGRWMPLEMAGGDVEVRVR